MNFNNIATDVLLKATGRAPSRGMSGVGDFVDPFVEGVRPATSMPLPPGPANFPMSQPPLEQPKTIEGWLERTCDWLSRIYTEIVRQNISARPVVRCKDVDNTGQTLDWTSVGIMDRITLKNDGPDEVWLAFDTSGPAVFADTSDLSFPLKADSTLNLTHSLFSKIGVRCAPGDTAVVNAIAWQTVAGNQNAAIS